MKHFLAVLQSQWRRFLAERTLWREKRQKASFALTMKFMTALDSKDYHESSDDDDVPSSEGDQSLIEPEPVAKLINKYHKHIEPALTERCKVIFCDLNTRTADEFAELFHYGHAEVVGRYERFAVWCAYRMVAWWRMIVQRHRYFMYYTTRKYMMYHVAATQISRSFLRYFSGKYGRHWLYLRLKRGKSKRRWLPVDYSAWSIQNVWLGYSSKKVYQFYRRLVCCFDGSGNPKKILAAINPREAALVDPASRLRLKFRLGGLTFPPQIYYKIFVHAPVCDVNSFAPRDYKTEKVISEKAHQIQCSEGEKVAQKTKKILLKSSYSAWYTRIENNGWRPVNVKTLKEAEDDAINQLTKNRIQSIKPKQGYGGGAIGAKSIAYTKPQKKQLSELNKKMRRRQWLMKLYTGGFACTYQTEEGTDTVSFNEETKYGSIKQSCLPSEEEVEQLLEWSSTLDFDQYVDEWEHVGTSGIMEPPSPYLRDPYNISKHQEPRSIDMNRFDQGLAISEMKTDFSSRDFRPPFVHRITEDTKDDTEPSHNVISVESGIQFHANTHTDDNEGLDDTSDAPVGKQGGESFVVRGTSSRQRSKTGNSSENKPAAKGPSPAPPGETITQWDGMQSSKTLLPRQYINQDWRERGGFPDLYAHKRDEGLISADASLSQCSEETGSPMK